MTTRTQTTFCRICNAMCGLVITVDDHDDGSSTVIKVRGDEAHPMSRGYCCPKGRALPGYHHHPARLDAPLFRSSRQAALETTDWPRALDDLAGVIAATVAAYGPDAVASYAGTASAFDSTGRPALDRFMRELGSTQKYSSLTVDTPSKPLISELMAGWANLFPIIHSGTKGVMLLVGTNPVVSHGHSMSLADPVRRLREFAAQGAELWVVDPRRSETATLAETLGGRHLQPRPSTDWMILAYLARELLGPDGGADADELAAAVDPGELDVVRSAVEPYTLDVVAARTALHPNDLAGLLAAIRAADGFSVITGTGTSMQRAANVTEWLAWVLLIVTGSLDRPRGMWCNPGFVRQAHRAPPRVGSRPAQPGPRSRPELPRLIGELPCAALASEIEAGNVRVLIVYGGSPLTAIPESDRLAAAFRQLDALVVIDVVHNDLAEHATHVLAATDQLERADVPLLSDNLQIAYGLQFTPAVVEPAAERRPAWWMFAELAARLQLSTPLPSGYDSASASAELLLEATLSRAALSLDELRAHPSGVVVGPPVFGWVHEHLLPAGRWRLAPEEILGQFAELGGDEATGVLLTPRRLPKLMNSQLQGLTSNDSEGIHLNVADAEALGIADGEQVVVRTAHGHVEATVHLDPAVGRGVAAMTHGWREPNASRLTSSTTGVDPWSGMVQLSGIPVTVTAKRTEPDRRAHRPEPSLGHADRHR